MSRLVRERSRVSSSSRWMRLRCCRGRSHDQFAEESKGDRGINKAKIFRGIGSFPGRLVVFSEAGKSVH